MDGNKSLTERTVEEGKWQQRKLLSQRKHAHIYSGKKKTFIHNCIAMYVYVHDGISK